jgi:cell division protein FtsI/penicillin-binding protein 2
MFALSLEPEPERVYPQAGGGRDTSLAANLLGFVNRDGIGQYGVEQQYQDTLAGSPRVVVADRDATGRAVLERATVTQPGIPGTDVRLTIDAGLQFRVEQELLAAWIADKARRVSAVVLDPYTGEVYAEATYPSYDANDYMAIAASDPSRFIDPVVASVYEPGSVFKMMTATAALELGTVTPSTRIKDVGTLRLDGGRTKIDDADRKGMGWMTFQDGVAYSRNVVAAKVALGLGDSTRQSSAALYDMWLRLGYGELTGIDVAGEVGGIVRDPALTPWREIDLANGAFGQGVAVTPIQLATAFAALANGGALVRPHVVQGIGDEDVTVAPPTQVIDAALSRTLVKMMRHVVTEVPFYRDRTLVPGYDVGGKTGTAQIWDPKANDGKGAWKRNLFNYSFVGFIGRQTGIPDLIVAIQIEEGTPTVARVGHLEMPVMSFELFRRIATNAITTPDLLTDRPTTPVLAADR